jgi:hypothetical protein
MTSTIIRRGEMGRRKGTTGEERKTKGKKGGRNTYTFIHTL